jgi:hypothetical protein
MALQPLWTVAAFFQFLNLCTVGRTPWTGDQPVARPLPTHMITQTQNKRTQYRHPCLEWNSNPRPECWAGEDGSCLRPRGQCNIWWFIYLPFLWYIAYIMVYVSIFQNYLQSLSDETSFDACGDNVQGMKYSYLFRVNKNILMEHLRDNNMRTSSMERIPFWEASSHSVN